MDASAVKRPAHSSQNARAELPKIIGIALAVIAVVGSLFAYFVWPTPWAYNDEGPTHYRVNRITSETQIRLSDGWSTQ